jgi:hypothetical protein
MLTLFYLFPTIFWHSFLSSYVKRAMKKQDQFAVPELSEFTINDLLAEPSLQVNGQYVPDEDDDDADDEDDLVLGDEDEIAGDEEEFEVEVDDAAVEVEDVTEDDLILDTDVLDEDEDDEDI